MIHHISFLATLIALLTIANPIGNIPLFLALTEKQSLRQQRRTAVIGAFAVMVTLIVVLFLGRAILKLFEIQLSAFVLAGQIVVITLAWSMLHAEPNRQRHTPQENDEAATRQSVAVVPLAIPILAGPGAMSMVITYASKATASQDVLGVLIIVTVSVAIAVCLLFAPKLQNLLGITGMNVLTRIFGLLLMAVSIGNAANALKELFPMLAGR